MAVFTMVGTAKKYTVWYYCLFRNLGHKFAGTLRGSKCDEDCIFSWRLYIVLFPFYEKGPSAFDPAGFFRNIFTPNPGDVFN